MQTIARAVSTRHPSLPTSTLRTVTMLVMATVLSGCAGRVDIVPFSRRDLPPGRPLIGHIPVKQAFYGRRENGELEIVLAHDSESIVDEALSAHWLMSIVLDGMPAGEERLYTVDQNTVRTIQSHGFDQRRGRSLSGVIVVRREKGDALSGRFHITMLEQSFNVLSGWSGGRGGSPQIMVGEFRARREPEATTAARLETETEGLPRPLEPFRPPRRPVTTQPAANSQPQE